MYVKIMSHNYHSIIRLISLLLLWCPCFSTHSTHIFQVIEITISEFILLVMDSSWSEVLCLLKSKNWRGLNSCSQRLTHAVVWRLPRLAVSVHSVGRCDPPRLCCVVRHVGRLWIWTKQSIHFKKQVSIVSRIEFNWIVICIMLKTKTRINLDRNLFDNCYLLHPATSALTGLRKS